MVTRTPGRRKRLIKPFCPFTTTKAPCPKQHPFFSGKYFGTSYFGKCNCLVAWTTATKIRDFKGAPSTHICPILPPDLSPDAHLFCPSGTVFAENINSHNLADNFWTTRRSRTPFFQTVISYDEHHQECCTMGQPRSKHLSRLDRGHKKAGNTINDISRQNFFPAAAKVNHKVSQWLLDKWR